MNKLKLAFKILNPSFILIKNKLFMIKAIEVINKLLK
jgi:hypothetical protein